MSDAASLETVRAAFLAQPPRAGRTRVLAVDGRSGSGKSTFAGAIAPLLGAQVVGMEFLYPGWDGLEAGIDVLVDRVLLPISEGRPAAVPSWDYASDDWAATAVTVAPEALLVVEGVGAGAARAARFASLVVWLELEEDARRRRALARDADMYAPHWERWARQEERLLARERTWERADLVLPVEDISS